MPVWYTAGGDAEVLVLDGPGDGAGFPGSYRNLVYGADGRDLRGGAGEEDLVRDVQHLPRNLRFADFMSEILRDSHY